VCKLNAKAHQIDSVSSASTFIRNEGQWENPALFLYSANHTQVFFENRGLRYFFDHPEDIQSYFDHQKNPHLFKTKTIRRHAVFMEFINSGAILPQGEEEQQTKLNFIQGNEPKYWKSNVRTYQIIRYKNLYTGVDLKIYPHIMGVKYDFIVQPKTDYQQIKWKYKGAEKVLLKNRQLHIKTSVNTLIDLAPFAYQWINGVRMEVACEFTLNKMGEIGFVLGDYNPNFEIVIDPVLVISTYSGSSVDNFGHSATFDDEGNLYTAGIARNPTDFPNGRYPVTIGAFQTTWGGGVGNWPQFGFPCDISISKYNNDGSNLIYATYLGGNRNEYPISIVADNQGNLFILGTTLSANYPTTFGAYQTTKSDSFDIIVSKLSANGTQLLGSTYFGGNGIDGLNIADTLRMNYADEFRGEIQLSPTGDVYIVSNTISTNLTGTSNALQSSKNSLQDGIILKFNSSLSQLKAFTFLGQNKQDAIYSIDVYPNSSIIVAGGTQSQGFNINPAHFKAGYNGGISDAFVAIIDSNLSQLTNIRYWGSNTYDQAYFVKLDPQQRPVLMGQAFDSIFVSSGVYRNSNGSLFITKFTQQLNQVVFSTQIGNGAKNNALAPSAFMVDVCGKIYGSVWGGAVNFQSRFRQLQPGQFQSSTSGLPVSTNAFQTNTDNSDFYLFVLSENGDSLNYATFFGENNDPDHVDGGTSRFDKRGIVYQSVCASCSGGVFGSFPTTIGSYSPKNESPRCSNAGFKFDFRQGNVLTADFLIQPRNGCSDTTILFQNNSFGATKNYWYINNQLKDSTLNFIQTFNTPGQYQVKLVVTNAATCNAIDSIIKNIQIQPSAKALFDAVFDTCSTKLNFQNKSRVDTGFVANYLWLFGDGDTSTLSNPTHTYLANGNFPVQLIVNSGSICADTAETIVVIDSSKLAISSSFLPSDSLFCAPFLLQIRNNRTQEMEHYWQINNMPLSRPFAGFDTILNQGVYRVSLIEKSAFSCNKADTFTRTFTFLPERFPDFNFIIDSCTLRVDFQNTSFAQPGDSLFCTWDFGDGNISNSFQPNHKYADTGNFEVTLTLNKGFPCERKTTKQVRIELNERQLLSRFNIEPEPICEPTVVQLINTSLNNTKSYWYRNAVFMDSTQQQVFDTIKLAGKYVYTLVTYNPNTCKLYDTLSMETNAYPSAVANFVIKKDSCSNAVILTNKSSSNSTSGINYLWDFGNGFSSTQAQPNISYDTTGKYLITLITQPGTPCADTATQALDFIKDSHELTADFDLTDSVFCNPLYLSVNSTGINGKQFEWYINQQLEGIGANFKDTIETAGTYRIKLRVIDSSSCALTDSILKNITVENFSEADFNMSRDSCSLLVRFSNLSTGSTASSFVWNFGDGDTSKQINPEHEYKQGGTYTVRLIYNAGSICADTAENVYTIDGDTGELLFIPNVFTPNNDGDNDCYKILGVSTKCDEYKIIVYNRWGNPVYENLDGSKCWNGNAQNGEPLPSGVYYYIMKVKKREEAESTHHGTITLIRGND